jgi:hypothetical protein
VAADASDYFVTGTSRESDREYDYEHEPKDVNEMARDLFDAKNCDLPKPL